MGKDGRWSENSTVWETDCRELYKVKQSVPSLAGSGFLAFQSGQFYH